MIKRITVVGCFCFVLILMFAATGMASDNNFFLNENQVRTYTGDVSGAIQEQYLYQQSGSNTAIESNHSAPPFLTKRWADNSNWFTYRLPIAANTPGPLYVSMMTKGEVKLTIAGTVVLNTGPSGQGDYTTREFKLTNSANWANGYVEVKFEDADPATGWGPNVYYLEVGQSSRSQDRIKHIQWDTTNTVWYAGYQDGYPNEFQGVSTDFTLGGDITTLANSGTVKLRWNQTVNAGKKYYLLVGVIGHGITGNDTFDMKNDGLNVFTRANPTGEKIYNVDITSEVADVNNVVTISIPAGAKYDFFAIVESSTTPVMDLNSLRISFGGSEQATNFTKLINSTMYYTLEQMNYENTGFIDASPRNGAFPGYALADMGPAMTEIFKWGYLNRVRESLAYIGTDVSYDIAAGNLVFNTMANLMRADNLSAATQTSYWANLKAGMDNLHTYMLDNPYNLVFGTNFETSSHSLGVYVNSTAFTVLKNAADIASRTGHTTDSTNWNNWADTIYNSMMTNLIWPSDTTWLGQPMKKGSWKYGINRDGTNPGSVYAAWHSVGSAKDGYFGLKEDIPGFRSISNYTLDTHMSNLWPSWKTYGYNRGFGTDYGVLSERGGWPLNSLLEADRMGDAKKNLEHVTFNSTDLNFAPYGLNTANFPGNEGGFGELSPWAIIRETDATDKGASNVVGNGPGNEDMNLIEYILFLKNARIMGGIDDALYGTNNLVLIPRLPWGWDSVNINSWPITYKNGSNFAQSTVTYNMAVSPLQATMNILAANAITGVQMRLGPFDPTAKVSSVTANGSAVSYTKEVKGDAAWVWVTQDIGTTNKVIVANMTVPTQLVNYNFNTNSLAGYTSNGGTWTASNAQAHVTSTGDAWNIAAESITDGSVSADVRLNSGNAAGVSIRTNSTGSTGYDLIIDDVDGTVKIARRPYTVLTSAAMNVSLQRTYGLKLVANGSTLQGYVNGVKVLETTDSTYSSGKHGLFSYISNADYDNVILSQSLILSDTFPGTGFTGWTANGGTWTNNANWAQDVSSGDSWFINTATGANFQYSADVQLTSGNAAGISFRTNAAGGTQGYDLILDKVDSGGILKLAKRPFVVLGSVLQTIVYGQTYNLKVVAVGSKMDCYLDGVLKFTVNDGYSYSGNFGLFGYTSTAKFDNVMVNSR